MNLRFALLMIALTCSTSVQAQSAGCAELPGFADFDFWVGEWEVFDNNTGNRAGENSIQKMEAGCMLLEGSIYNFAGAVWNFRGTWTPNADGSVRQFFEQFNHDSEVWEPWIDGRYVRK